MRPRSVQIVACAMALLLPVSAAAENASAMLNASGTVTVNGAQVARSTAVFSGDKIQTAANGVASLTSEGSSVLVPGNTSVAMFEDRVDMECGTVVVTTVKGMGARSGNLTVAPAGASAKFEIRHLNGRLEVVPREGALNVNHGGTMSSLLPGKTFSTASSTCVPAVPNAAQTAPPAGGSSAGHAKLLGIAAAGAGALVLFLVLRDTSPDTPAP